MKISNQSLKFAILAAVFACSGQAQTAKSEPNSSSATPLPQKAAALPPASKPEATGASQKDQPVAAQADATQKGTAQADPGKSPLKASNVDANPTETAATAAAAARQPLLSRSDSEVPGLGQGRLAGTISAASKEMEQHTARAMAGRMIRGTDGKRLGKIKDLLLEPRSGEIPYAVVSSGGLFARDRLCLVPFKALKPDGSHPKDFTVALNEDQWMELNSLGDQEFESGHISITDSERRAIARRFGQAQAGNAASGSEFYTEGINSYLIRAEEIRGRDVYAGESAIGSIKDVVMDPTYGTAYALFDPSSRFSKTKQDFVVPLNRYAFGATKQDRVTTMLERADFDRMRDIIEPSQAVGPNATAANKGAPRQGVAVQEQGNAALANAKAAAVATGSFGGSTAPGVAGQVGQAGSAASNPAAQSEKGNGQSDAAQANSAQQANASNRTKAGQATAANSKVGSAHPANGSGDRTATSDNAGQISTGGEQAKASAQASDSTNTKQGATTADSPAGPANQKSGPVAQAAKPEKANEGSQSSKQSNASAGEKSGPTMAADTKTTEPLKSAAPKTEAVLEPTGRTNAEPNAPGGESVAAAKAIRQMLDQESAEIARIEVTIDPNGGALVLKGVVTDSQMKKNIEDQVTKAAKGARIDSQITVENK